MIEVHKIHSPQDANASDLCWRALLDLDAQLHSGKGVRLLTPEGRVLMSLTLAGPMPVATAMKVAGASYRGFYDVLDRLKRAGLIAKVKDSQDQRVRRISINIAVQPFPIKN